MLETPVNLSRTARGYALACWLVAFVVIVVSLLGCAAPQRPTKIANALDQRARAVRIVSACVTGDPYSPTARSLVVMGGGTGSGVIVGDDTVLTAAHVIKCGPNTVNIIRVIGTDELRRWGSIVVVDTTHDIARLRVDGVRAPELERATAIPGEPVCVATAEPDRVVKCGTIEKLESFTTREGSRPDIWYTVRTVPGNSGAGVYNRRGQLVGLHTNKWTETDGGLGTSVVGRVL